MSAQTQVFYNARLALRDGDPALALKLWLLRNSLAQQSQAGTHDAEFRSVVWAALGNLGLCQDGFAKDSAGLWSLAFHNWLLLTAAKGDPPDARTPFDAFEVARQQRHISLHDVLSTAELRSATFFRTPCLMPTTELKQWPGVDLKDRLVLAPLLRAMLKGSLRTLRRDQLDSVAVIETRIFDLDLAIARLREQRARRDGRNTKQRARRVGLSEVAAREVEERVRTWPADSREAAFLRKALGWTPREWLALSKERRLALYLQAKPLAPKSDPLRMEIIDALMAQRAGAEVEGWIGLLDETQQDALIQGERGARLLELDPSTGFHERSAIALRRGVAFLETGSLRDALRSFAFALSVSADSREGQTALSLSRRWLSYVLSRYETNDEVVATLKALVPKQEYNAVTEDLVWRAAFSADARSFERIVASASRGGSFDNRALKLRPLSQGNAAALVNQLRDAMKDEPFLTMRFVRVLLERLELEEAGVRQANASLLRAVLELLEENSDSPIKSHAAAADELTARTQEF
ncbi:MAG: hypothetical protein ACT4TC_11605 [Myxococcaceae bacterium]